MSKASLQRWVIYLNQCNNLYRQCKKHFLDRLGKRVKNEIKMVYKNPENSFAAFDTQSIGEVTIDGFINSKVIKRLCIDSTDLISWLIRDKIFLTHTASLNFENFKKKFFSHLYIIEDYDGDSNFQHNSIPTIDRDSIMKQLKDLEVMLKTRFQNTWTSVRRAFLDLDTN